MKEKKKVDTYDIIIKALIVLTIIVSILSIYKLSTVEEIIKKGPNVEFEELKETKRGIYYVTYVSHEKESYFEGRVSKYTSNNKKEELENVTEIKEKTSPITKIKEYFITIDDEEIMLFEEK